MIRLFTLGCHYHDRYWAQLHSGYGCISSYGQANSLGRGGTYGQV